MYNMQSPHLPTLLAIHYFASLLPDTPIRREDADAFIDSATRELNSNVTADLALRGDTYSQSQIASLARLVSSCSNGKLDVTSCSNLTDGIDLAYNNIKSKKQTDESKIPVFTFVIQVGEVCKLVCLEYLIKFIVYLSCVETRSSLIVENEILVIACASYFGR